jgi:hypothetical protein
MNLIWQELPCWPDEHIGKAFTSQLLLSQYCPKQILDRDSLLAKKA